MAPPDRRASISSSEKSSRPYVAGMIYLGSMASARSHPSLPRNVIDGTRCCDDALVVVLVLAVVDATGVGVGPGAAATAGSFVGADSEAAEASTVASASESISYKSAPTSTSSSLYDEDVDVGPCKWSVHTSISVIMNRRALLLPRIWNLHCPKLLGNNACLRSLDVHSDFIGFNQCYDILERV